MQMLGVRDQRQKRQQRQRVRPPQRPAVLPNPRGTNETGK